MMVEDIGSLREKLLAVSNEIDDIKNSFAKGAEDLSRVQSMLSVGDIENISGVVEKFQSKIDEAEKQRLEASEGAKKYSEELEKEKERLIKLWDAYKNQEEELSKTEKKIQEFEERTREEDSFDTLSRREKEVFLLLAEGRSIKETADQLFISRKTVESHKYNIMEKLQANSIVDLTKIAIRKNLMKV